MTEVKMQIEAVILGCDETVLSLNIGKGYSLKKINLDDFSHKKEIVDGNGTLTLAYRNLSQNFARKENELIILFKECTQTITIPHLLKVSDMNLRALLIHI